MNKAVRNFLNIVGAFYIILGIGALVSSLIYWEVSGVLWFSYIVMLLIGLGLLMRSSYLVASQLAIVFIPYLVWSVDFFFILFTGNTFLGITDYFFTQRSVFSQIVSLQHIYTIPISFLAIYFIKLKRSDFWKFSSVQVIIFFFLSRLFTNPELNINCVFESCIPLTIPFLPYPVTWFLSYGIMIVLTTFLLNKIKVFSGKNKL